MKAWIVVAGIGAFAGLAACEQQQPAAPAENGTSANDAAASANDAAASANAAAASANEAAGSQAPAAGGAPLAKAAADPNMQWGPCPEGMPEGCGIAVLHGDPAKPNTDIFLRVPGGSAIPPHSHSSAERMILVSGQLDVKYQGAPTAALTAGQYAYGPPKLPHSGQCRSSEPCTLFIAFEQPVDVVPFKGTLE